MYLRAFRIANFLDGLAWTAPPFVYLVGAAILTAKLLGAWSQVPPGLPWLILVVGTALAFATAWLRARRTPCTEEYVLAWLDLHNKAGGRILAGDPDALRETLAVSPTISPLPVLKGLPLPMLFVVATLLVPERADASGPSAKGVERKIAALERAVRAVEEQKAVPEKTAAALRESLQSVERAAVGNPEAAAEAADAVRKQLENAVLSRVESGLRSLEKANRAREAMADANRARDPVAAQGAMRDLAEALESLLNQEGGLGNLPDDLRQALEEMMRNAGAADLGDIAKMGDLDRLSAEDLKKLAEALRETACRFGECAGACQLGPGTREALLAMLAGMPALSEQGLNELLVPGPWGVGTEEGEHASRLTFGSESDADGARFEPKALPPGQAFLPGTRMGVERQAVPDEMPPEEFRAVVRTGVGVDGPVHAGETGAPLGPDRAEAAMKYFDRLARPAP